MLASRPERWITRRDAIKGLTAGAVGAVTGAVVHGYVYERRALRVVRATLPVSGLPDGLVGVRVGFLTDLHRSRTVPHDLIAGAVDLLGREEPDVVLLGGDYVTDGDRQYAEPAAEVLEEQHGVAAEVWSVTSFTELRRDGRTAKKSWVAQCLEGGKGPVIAASDYVSALADLIREWVPGKYVTLGTDGFGRSDTRAALRAHFGVDRAAIVRAALGAID